VIIGVQGGTILFFSCHYSFVHNLQLLFFFLEVYTLADVKVGLNSPLILGMCALKSLGVNLHLNSLSFTISDPPEKPPIIGHCTPITMGIYFDMGIFPSEMKTIDKLPPLSDVISRRIETLIVDDGIEIDLLFDNKRWTEGANLRILPLYKIGKNNILVTGLLGYPIEYI
jgi:hypothetical protein